MNRRMIIHIIGILLLSVAILMLLPLAVALIYGEGTVSAFLISIGITALFGGLCLLVKPRSSTIFAKDGFVIVTFAWLLAGVFGSLPFIISGEIPGFVDALFETVSGFTTTGASILSDVETLSRSLIFWRSFTHWIGGMGVLVFVMAVLPLVGGGGSIHLFRAESPGPDVTKLVPSGERTAKILYTIYFVMTATEVAILLFCGLPLFDALTLSFGTAGTGGFGIKNDSIASYPAAAQTVITVFMALFGVNFSAYYFLCCRRVKEIFKNTEIRVYFLIMLVSIAILTFDIRGLYPSTGAALHDAAFQISSVMTTTGYTTADFNLWPELSKVVMLVVMCIGACAGSTGGGFKVSRIIILAKSAKNELMRMIHPRRVSVVMLDGHKVDETAIRGTMTFFVTYVGILVFSIVAVSFDEHDILTNISGVIATLNNIGPGFNVVGATGNYSSFSAVSKLVFIADMLFGRLEIIPILLALTPASWKK